MKYVTWVDRVFNAARRLHAQDPETARYGMQILQLPAVLGFGEVASRPGFSDSDDGLWGAIHVAIGDIRQLGLVDDLDQWRFKLLRHAHGSGEVTLSMTWHQIFDQ